MLESGFEEINHRAPWPADAGEKLDSIENSQRSGDALEDDISRPETIRFQGMRVTRFCVDCESTKDQIILNRIVGLKEDTGKD